MLPWYEVYDLKGWEMGNKVDAEWTEAVRIWGKERQSRHPQEDFDIMTQTVESKSQ